MSLNKRSTPYIVIAVFAVTSISIVIKYWETEVIRQGIGLTPIAILLGIFISNYTEKYLGTPAERLMNLVSGFGIKGQDAEFDENGVPVISLRRLGKKFNNPVAVSMAAFRYFKEWESTKDEKKLLYFKNCASWLASHLKDRRFNDFSYGVWEYDYPWTYELKPPWISGLAQGVGVQILSRAYKTFKDEKYLEAGRKALNSFFVEVENGGVTYKDSPEEWWYEEYAKENAKKSRVLNGMIYALLGIFEYHQNTKNQDAKYLFDKGIRSLKRNIGKFDSGSWTYYDEVGTISTKSYHYVHIDLLKELRETTGEKDLDGIQKKWSEYKRNFFVQEFIKQRPSWHDLTILGLNIVFSFVVLEIIFFVYFRIAL